MSLAAVREVQRDVLKQVGSLEHRLRRLAVDLQFQSIVRWVAESDSKVALSSSSSAVSDLLTNIGSKPSPTAAPQAVQAAESKVESSVASSSPAIDMSEHEVSQEPTPIQLKNIELARTLGLTSSAFRRCPDYYYSKWGLEQRRAYLGAPSCAHLCKSMVMHNTKCTNSDFSDPLNSKYYLVIFQYIRRFNNEKLIRYVHSELNQGQVAKKKFNFRLAPEEVSDSLTGYRHNGVSPLGMASSLPIVVSHHIAALKDSQHDFIWLGGGEPDLKWKISVSEFMRVFKPYVANITDEGEIDVTAPASD